jgi:hypothetical protein
MGAIAVEETGNYARFLKVALTADTPGATLGSRVNNPNSAASRVSEKKSGTNPGFVALS